MRSLQHHSKATTSRPRRPPCRARRSKSAAATGYGASCSRAITSRTTSAGCAPRGNHTPEHAICLGTARGDAAARDASRPRVERGGPETPRRGKYTWTRSGGRSSGGRSSLRHSRWRTQLFKARTASYRENAALQGTHRFVRRENAKARDASYGERTLRHATLRTAREREGTHRFVWRENTGLPLRGPRQGRARRGVGRAADFAPVRGQDGRAGSERGRAVDARPRRGRRARRDAGPGRRGRGGARVDARARGAREPSGDGAAPADTMLQEDAAGGPTLQKLAGAGFVSRRALGAPRRVRRRGGAAGCRVLRGVAAPPPRGATWIFRGQGVARRRGSSANGVDAGRGRPRSRAGRGPTCGAASGTRPRPRRATTPRSC